MFFADYTVKQLSSLASDLKIKGRSKMDKQELFAAVSDVINEQHSEALRMNWQENTLRLNNVTSETHVVKFSGTVLPREISVPFVASNFLASDEKRLPRKLKKLLKKACANLSTPVGY